jgi:16S rRNA (guanine527-N7)-methyltransferase
MARMFHVKHKAWARDLERLGHPLDSSALDALAAYEEALRDRAVPRGFVSASDADRLWERHIRDSLRAIPQIPAGAGIADLGSGAGLPGLPLAIAMPAHSVTLVEPRRGRVAFLESVVDQLDLGNVDVFLGKAERLNRRFDVCTTRAFAPPEGSWIASEPLLREGGRVIYWAGEGFDGSSLNARGVPWRVSTPSGLAESGPLVIMGRQ